jgi:hypothetical protein
MNKIMRSAVLAVPAGVAILAGTTAPAYAQGAGSFHGNAHINCFGCGPSNGTANLKVTGEVNGTAKAEADVFVTYSLNEDPTTCPAQGTASGSYSGALNGTFNWTRVGASAVLTVSGDINGAGVAVFATTKAGLPCGGPVDAVVAGSVAGT